MKCNVTAASLCDGVRDVATLQGDLRATHLEFHLAVADLLTPQQIARYAALRGYGQGAPAPPPHQGHGRH